MTLVFDATPLIYLAKADRLDLLTAFERPRLVPERVYAEVVEAGVERGYPDARRVQRGVEAGTLTVRAAEAAAAFERFVENPNLSDADAAVLALARQTDGTAVMDEQYGRTVAETEDVPTRGTVFLALSCVEQGVLTADEARAAIDELVDAGWYCSTDLYAKIRRKLDSLS